MTNPISPDALDEKSLPQKIAEDIIALILEEHLQPGDKLPNESNLSNRLHAGRSSIREAMKLLASRNIVTIRQGSGTYVAASPGMVEDPLGFTFIGDKKKLWQTCWTYAFYLNLPLLQWLQNGQMKTTSGKSLLCAAKWKIYCSNRKITFKKILNFIRPLP